MYELFEKLLHERGVTAYQVAKATGISTGSLSDWKKGRSKPKLEKLQKIADYFGVSVDYFTGEQKEKPGTQMDAEQEVRYEHSLGVTNVARDLQQELDKLRLLEDPLVAFYGEVKDQLDDDDREDLIAFLRIKAERKNKK